MPRQSTSLTQATPERIAETALWLTDHQMNIELSLAFGNTFQRIPLKASPHIKCTNALRFDWNELLPALRRGEADAVIAAQRITPSLLKEFDVSDRYFYTAAWFAGLRTSPRVTTTPEQLERRRIAVARGSPHEAYLRTFFRESAIETTDTVEQAREAVRQGRADLVFGDGISLVFWVNGSLSQDCCELKGGPFFEPKFFGDGLAITVPRQDVELKRMINRTLARLRRNGRYEELILRYFPNRIF